MKSRITQIALRIALIKEEFVESEIFEAIKLLEKYGYSSELLAYLSGHKISDSVLKEEEIKNKKNKPVDEQRSKAVIELEKKDPEKYQVLFEFDMLIRKRDILPELGDIKRLGEQISKDFTAKKTRREAISSLMTLIAEQPIDEMRKIIISTVSSVHLNDKSNEYQELAKFIIKGKSLQT
jgi:hypothetical protein